MTEEFQVEQKHLDAEYFNIGIVGTNMAAQTLEYAFKHKPRNAVMVVDNINHHIEDLIEFEPNITFLCNEVTMSDDDTVEAAELEDAILQLSAKTNSGIVIKTPLPMELVERNCKNQKVVYYPDLYFGRDTIEAQLNVPYACLGGSSPNSTMAVAEIIHRFSTFSIGHFHHITPTEVCFIEQVTGAMLTVKSVFAAQLHDTVNEFGGDYHTIASILASDGRIGTHGLRQPNTDDTMGENSQQAKNALRSLKKFSDRFTFLEECGIMNDRYQQRD